MRACPCPFAFSSLVSAHAPATRAKAGSEVEPIGADVRPCHDQRTGLLGREGVYDQLRFESARVHRGNLVLCQAIRLMLTVSTTLVIAVLAAANARVTGLKVHALRATDFPRIKRCCS